MSSVREEMLERTKKLRFLLKNKLYECHPEIGELSLNEVKTVLVINAPPRSGSSMLYHFLSKSDHFYSLNGEAVPFYRLHCPYEAKRQTFSDEDNVILNSLNLESLSEDFLLDTYVRCDIKELVQHKEAYFIRVLLRLVMQWPNINFSLDNLFEIVEKAFACCILKEPSTSLEEFYLEFLKLLVEQYEAINPYYYDIDPEALRAVFPNLELPCGPPNPDFLLEEPPFILVPFSRNVSKKELNTKVLLLKTSIDLYNMERVKNLFPGADFKVVFLLRNPAGTINGLYDGWLHRGFFSHNLSDHLRLQGLKDLNIRGYSTNYKFSKTWWNFDLPPNWLNYINKSLEEVCCFQWYSSVSKIKEMMGEMISEIDFSTVHYEKIINLSSRYSELLKIFSLLSKELDLSLEDMPVVQATLKPKMHRWRERQNIILPILNNAVMELAAHYGYTLDNLDDWL